jgi:hypothetical protein
LLVVDPLRDGLIGYVPNVAATIFETLNFARVDIETDRGKASLNKRSQQGQANVSESNDTEGRSLFP